VLYQKIFLRLAGGGDDKWLHDIFLYFACAGRLTVPFFLIVALLGVGCCKDQVMKTPSNEYAGTYRGMALIAEGIINLQKLLNIRHGWKKENDFHYLKRFLEPVQDGPAAGKVPVGLDEAILDYYQERGWGKPEFRLLKSSGSLPWTAFSKGPVETIVGTDATILRFTEREASSTRMLERIDE